MRFAKNGESRSGLVFQARTTQQLASRPHDCPLCSQFLKRFLIIKKMFVLILKLIFYL